MSSGLIEKILGWLSEPVPAPLPVHRTAFTDNYIEEMRRTDNEQLQWSAYDMYEAPHTRHGQGK